jgi:two-component system, NarL family, response regulator LiaR
MRVCCLNVALLLFVYFMHCLEPVPQSAMPYLAPVRILVMDASPLMQLKLKQAALACPQWQILDFVVSGTAPTSVVKSFDPDLVMLDADVSDAETTLITLKSALPDLRVLILSSDRRESQAVQAFSLGANAYFVKNSSSKQLAVAIACIQDGAVYLDPHIARGVVKQLQAPALNPPATMLSKRELEILQLLVAGKTNIEMAKTLYLSPHTIKSHVRSIMNKLAVDDRVQIAVTAFRSGLIKSYAA